MNKLVVLLIGILWLVGCDNSYQIAQQVISQKMPDMTADENDNFIRLSDDYFQQYLALHPIDALYAGDFSKNNLFVDNLTDDYLKARHEHNALYLRYLNGLDSQKLSAKNLISFKILKSNLQTALHGEAFPSHYLPFSQFDSLMSTMAQLGSGQGAQPFNTIDDYDAFYQRLSGYVLWFDTAIERLREGIDNKVVLPRVLVNRLLNQLSAHVVPKTQDSIFYAVVSALPQHIPPSEQARITKSYRQLIEMQLIPAYKRLINFLANEYIAHSRATDGYGALPNGLVWYQYLANKHTTTTMPVATIHQIGLKEVARILNEMDKVRQLVKFEGTLTEFFSHLRHDPKYYFTDKHELIARYNNYQAKIESVLPDYFSIMPTTPYVVKAVEPFKEQSAAGASYAAGSPDGSRAGIFYVNTFNLKAQPKWGMMTLSLHEAAPGHHFQISLSQQLSDIPDFQKFGGQTAFIEGWALYSEFLGVEMGLFNDPYQYFGKLADEMLRAMRLVVDTGLHAKGWSRPQAIAYMQANSTMAKSDVIAEVERYMAIPGQALSYKVGQLKLIELRQHAEQALGDKFDIKEFHNQVLLDGALPLLVLEAKIKTWITSRLSN